MTNAEEKNQRFVELYRKRVDQMHDKGVDDKRIHVESALCHLIKRFATELPDTCDGYFHKSFRQIDVLDFDAPEGAGGSLDMVFWNLLYCCPVFWKTVEEFKQKLKNEEEATTGGDDTLREIRT